MRGQIMVAIPLYRNAHLVAPLVQSLERCVPELIDLKANIVFIVDSPDDKALLDAVATATASLSLSCSIDVVINKTNIGFIRSINSALHRAITNQTDIIILNSDVEVFPGAFAEMQAVAHSDHMIGFVSPRSNNATICSLPYGPSFRHRSPEISYRDFCRLKQHLPRIEYVPTVVGFAMYIKWQILADFGVFDEVYGAGYNEENDLIMRANQCGYRAAIANHAFVFHIGEQSFDLRDLKKNDREPGNARILASRYPEYERSVKNYFSSFSFKAYELLDGLICTNKNKLNVAFDMTSFGNYFNGTVEAARNIISAFASLYSNEYNVYVFCSEHVFEFHKLNTIRDLKRLNKDEPCFLAAVIRIGQPYSTEDVQWLRMRAPIFCIFMLDTISTDCCYLATQELQYLWQSTIDLVDCVLFNSGYTFSQFLTRFRFPEDTAAIPALHSTDYQEYQTRPPISQGDYVLLVGNKFLHKHIYRTADYALRRYPGKKMVIMGVEGIDDENVKYIKSGQVSESEIANIYANSSVIMFPSHYEGFGFPIMNALAHHKPVVARRMPVYEEIMESTPLRENIHLFETTESMVDCAFSGNIRWNPARYDNVSVVKWGKTAKILHEYISIKQNALSVTTLKKKIYVAERMPSHAAESRSSSAHMSQNIIGKLSLVYDKKWRELRRAIMREKRPDLRRQLEAELIRYSMFFDEEYYMARNPDVKSAGVEGALHFATHGWREGRDPGPYFGTSWYIDAYTDIGPANINPLTHYLLFGVFEGREILVASWQKPVRLNVIPQANPSIPLVDTVWDLASRCLRRLGG